MLKDCSDMYVFPVHVCSYPQMIRRYQMYMHMNISMSEYVTHTQEIIKIYIPDVSPRYAMMNHADWGPGVDLGGASQYENLGIDVCMSENELNWLVVTGT